MTDHYTPVIDAVIATLSASGEIQAGLGNPARIYDQRPAMASFPYVVVGPSEARDAGTKTLAVSSQLLTLRIFSRQRSGKEVRQILSALHAVLHDAALTLSAGTAVRCQEEFCAVQFDEAAQASQGTARYRLVICG